MFPALKWQPATSTIMTLSTCYGGDGTGAPDGNLEVGARTQGGVKPGIQQTKVYCLISSCHRQGTLHRHRFFYSQPPERLRSAEVLPHSGMKTDMTRDTYETTRVIVSLSLHPKGQPAFRDARPMLRQEDRVHIVLG